MVDGRDELREQVRLLHDASFGWAMSLCGRQRAEAEDVLQAAYAKVLAGQARYEGRSSFRTWLFGVIRRTAQEHRRRRWFRFFGEFPPEPSAPPISPGGTTEQTQSIGRALAALASRQREILHLVFYEDLTIAEAAGIMKISIGSARQHYERGKARLRALLPEQGVEE